MVNENISPDWYLVLNEMSEKVVLNPEIARASAPSFRVVSYRDKPDVKVKIPGCFFGNFFSETYQQWFYFEIKHDEWELWLYDKENQEIVPDTDVNAAQIREEYLPEEREAIFKAVEAIFAAHPDYVEAVGFNLEDFKNDDFLLTYK